MYCEGVTKCRKCQGTGYIPSLARIDGGKCWACTDKVEAPTAEQVSDDEAYRLEMGLGLTLAERVALRRERRS